MVRLVLALVAAVAIGSALQVPKTAAQPQGASAAPPTADEAADIAFAQKLWQVLVAAKLAGPEATRTAPFKSPTDPPQHYTVLEYLEQVVTVEDATGPVVVKHAYDGPGVTVAKVWADPKAYFVNTTIMFRRKGYDPANNDWFWAEYDPVGKVELAGRAETCLACHAQRAAQDHRFLPDELAHPSDGRLRARPERWRRFP